MNPPSPNDEPARQADPQWRASLDPVLTDPGELWRQLLDRSADYVYVKDIDGRYVLNNEAHRKFLGVASLAEIVGKSVFDIFPRELAERYHADDRAVIESGQPLLDREEPVTGPTGRVQWVSTTKVPLRGQDGRVVGLACIGRNITNRKTIEVALAQEKYLLNALMETVPDHIYFKDRQSRFLRISRAQAARFGLRDPGEAVGKTDFDFFGAEHAQQAYEDEQRIMRTGEPLVGAEEKEVWPDGHVTWVSSTKVPLRDHQGSIIGTFGVSRDITERKLAQQQIALYAENLRCHNQRLEEDLNMAQEVQQAFLPDRYPNFPRNTRPEESALQFCHRYLPSGAVGGDFFSVQAISDTAAGVFLCDVMGHGVRAALVTAVLRTLLEEAKPQASQPGPFLTRINRRFLETLQQMRMPMFASAVYLVIDLDAGEVRYACAGHASPLHLRRSAGRVEPLACSGGKPGPALGLIGDFAYDSIARPISGGDLLMLYTDGLYEVPSASDVDYGKDRMLAAVRQRIAAPAPQLFDELLEEIRHYSAKKQFDDDVCLVGVEVVRLNTTPSPAP